MIKQYEAANKDKESMVMRYAVSEKEVIDQKRERESLEKKLREMGKEKDLLLGKLKAMSTEKIRLGQMLDSKVTLLWIKCVHGFLGHVGTPCDDQFLCDVKRAFLRDFLNICQNIQQK